MATGGALTEGGGGRGAGANSDEVAISKVFVRFTSYGLDPPPPQTIIERSESIMLYVELAMCIL